MLDQPFHEWEHYDTFRNYLNPTQRIGVVVP
jgi:hypothetical protein